METRQCQRKAERGWWEAPEGGAEDTGAGCAAQRCKSGTSTVQCGGEQMLVVVAGGRGRLYWGAGGFWPRGVDRGGASGDSPLTSRDVASGRV